ncbi:MAG: ribonuclease HII [Patescibacteria group bacterium]
MLLPDFAYELKLLEKGHTILAGIDEVGRGCFAGPVVAGCVVFDSEFIRSVKTIEVVIRDSKKMSTKQREKANLWIQNNALICATGTASVHLINTLGIKKATEIAVRQAVAKIQKTLQIDYLLLDAFYIPNVKGLSKNRQKPIIKGDSLSVSIAAASIVAKVYRDNLMTTLAQEPKYQMYGWEDNKGYGTKSHREAISQHGKTSFHRELFVRKYI